MFVIISSISSIVTNNDFVLPVSHLCNTATLAKLYNNFCCYGLAPVAEISQKSLWNDFDNCLENEHGCKEKVAYFQRITELLNTQKMKYNSFTLKF